MLPAAPAVPAVPAVPAAFVSPNSVLKGAGKGRPSSTDASICGCALHGFGSQQCDLAVASRCRRAAAGDPMCSSVRGKLAQSSKTVNQLSLILSSECFPGQSMDTSICTCVQVGVKQQWTWCRSGLAGNTELVCREN
jgi:hypothetical protein